MLMFILHNNLTNKDLIVHVYDVIVYFMCYILQ